MYYPCSENKGADQFHSNREADLRLCFRICKNPVFSRHSTYVKSRFIHDTVHPLFCSNNMGKSVIKSSKVLLSNSRFNTDSFLINCHCKVTLIFNAAKCLKIWQAIKLNNANATQCKTTFLRDRKDHQCL